MLSASLNKTFLSLSPYLGSMREIDVIDVARQEDYKMLMREWTEYYNSPNRHKIFNVISLEFSNTKCVNNSTVRTYLYDMHDCICDLLFTDFMIALGITPKMYFYNIYLKRECSYNIMDAIFKVSFPNI